MDFRDVRERREDLGLSISELVRKCHNRFSYSLLEMIENGARNLTHDKVMVLSSVFKCEPFLLALSQSLSNQGIALKDRKGAVDLYFGEFKRLLALKSKELKEKKLDFGSNRDAFGRTRIDTQVSDRNGFGLKSQKDKEIKRDAFGIVRKHLTVALEDKRVIDAYRDDPKGFEQKLQELLRKGEERRNK